MRSIFGECTGNVRSTPTPKDYLRTREGLAHALALPLDDDTLEHLRTAPGALDDLEVHLRAVTRLEAGRRRSCARSRESMTVLMARRASAGSGPPRKRRPMVTNPGAPSALLEAPLPDLLVVPESSASGTVQPRQSAGRV